MPLNHAQLRSVLYLTVLLWFMSGISDNTCASGDSGRKLEECSAAVES